MNSILALLGSGPPEDLSSVPIGPAPAMPTVKLPTVPGSSDVSRDVPLESAEFGTYLLTRAVDLLDSPNHKVRASVLHDLMEAQGMLKGKGSGPAPQAPNPLNLNQFVARPDAIAAIAEALQGLTLGRKVDPQ